MGAGLPEIGRQHQPHQTNFAVFAAFAPFLALSLPFAPFRGLSLPFPPSLPLPPPSPTRFVAHRLVKAASCNEGNHFNVDSVSLAMKVITLMATALVRSVRSVR